MKNAHKVIITNEDIRHKSGTKDGSISEHNIAEPAKMQLNNKTIKKGLAHLCP